jgi:hypothetical protein
MDTIVIKRIMDISQKEHHGHYFHHDQHGHHSHQENPGHQDIKSIIYITKIVVINNTRATYSIWKTKYNEATAIMDFTVNADNIR